MLGLSLSANPSSIQAGGRSQGTITVQNTGNLFDNNVVLNVTLPEGLSFPDGGVVKTFVLPFANVAHAASQSQTFPTISSLAPSASQSYTFDFDASGSAAPGPYTIMGSVVSSFYSTAIYAQTNVDVTTGGGGGGSQPTPTPTPSPEVAGASTGPTTGGQVLGASDVQLPQAGFGFIDRIYLSLMISIAATGLLLIVLGTRILPARLEDMFLSPELADRFFGKISA